MDGYAVTNGLLGMWHGITGVTRDIQGGSIATVPAQSRETTQSSSRNGPLVPGGQQLTSEASSPGWIDGILGDLQTLEYVLAETLLLLDKLHGNTPLSALGLLVKCRSTWEELEPMLRAAMSSNDGTTRDGSQRQHRKMPFANGVRSPHLPPSDLSAPSRRPGTGTHQGLEEGQHIERLCGKLQDAVMNFHHIAHNELILQILLEAIPTTSPRLTADRTDKFSEIKEMTSHFDGTISWIKSDKPESDGQSTQTEAPDANSRSREPSRRRTPRAADDNVGFFPVRGQFDSGANDNFISRSLIQRADLEHLIEDPASHHPLTVSTVIGEGTLTERLQLNISLHGSSRSDTLLFWVSEEGTFDILIGDEWMQKNERNVFGRRAFAAGHESRLVFKPQDKGTPPTHLSIHPSILSADDQLLLLLPAPRNLIETPDSRQIAKRKQADAQLEVLRQQALSESRRGSDVHRPPAPAIAPTPASIPVPLQGKGKEPVRPNSSLPARPPPRKKTKRSFRDLFRWKPSKDTPSSSDEGANGHAR